MNNKDVILALSKVKLMLECDLKQEDSEVKRDNILFEIEHITNVLNWFNTENEEISKPSECDYNEHREY